ncbi:glycoside hydrolase family 16 protein [Ancylobacter sp. A5.8]|uniref:glycoside hydrolase family 16 protein n=1 Tax=Ancylobacter gelatini TaxID=2919920 RepID=UPI001F4D386D|nr:glycoside hydrolase family 16 protein [Ancylobacter gelatini]MCJ8145219.1 glycoside hydrolase family 16 protein [Ancylobacter gelatini]
MTPTPGPLTSAALTVLATAMALTATREAAAAPEMTDAALSFCRMELAFADEFDDLSIAPRELGSARWIAHTPWGGDFGDAVFSDPGPGSPFTVRDGILAITASKDADGTWRSGLLASADSTGRGFGLRYGYFEARSKLPTGPGTWPAFWLNAIPDDTAADATMEVDILEYYGHARASYQAAYHLWSADPSREGGGLTTFAVPNGSLEADFHTYGAKVTPDHITFYLDRQPMWQVPTPASHRNRLMLLVNLALGSGFSISDTPNPTTMLVDYIRAYSFREPAPDCTDEQAAADDPP